MTHTFMYIQGTLDNIRVDVIELAARDMKQPKYTKRRTLMSPSMTPSNRLPASLSSWIKNTGIC